LESRVVLERSSSMACSRLARPRASVGERRGVTPVNSAGHRAFLRRRAGSGASQPCQRGRNCCWFFKAARQRHMSRWRSYADISMAGFGLQRAPAPALPRKRRAIAYENERWPHLLLTLPCRGRVGAYRAKRDARRGGVCGGQDRINRLRMNNHPTPTKSEEATLRPTWSTLPLQGRVGKFLRHRQCCHMRSPCPQAGGGALRLSLALVINHETSGASEMVSTPRIECCGLPLPLAGVGVGALCDV
jgi:hypothetical protein